MSLIQRRIAIARSPAQPLSVIVTSLFCAALFLFAIRFGSAPSADLDPSWTEVLAWGFLQSAQWGRDLVFTYGPLGFLHTGTSYIEGIFAWYVAGQIMLTAAFALACGLSLHRSRAGYFLLFALAYGYWHRHIPADISWQLTLLFGTTYLLGRSDEKSRVAFAIATVFSLICAVIALTKVSTFPAWVLTFLSFFGVYFFNRRPRQAFALLLVFPTALILVWLSCGQLLQNFIPFLITSLEFTSGYGHAMGLSSPAQDSTEFTGAMIFAVFLGACLCAAWQARKHVAALASIGFSAAVAAVMWRAGFTREDHTAIFFASMSFIPFALLCSRDVVRSRLLRVALILLVAASAWFGGAVTAPIAMASQMFTLLQGNVYALSHLTAVKAQREAQWHSAAETAALPKIRDRVGNARVDMLMFEQGVILLNGLHYAPRPVFQSYSAYTPKLARLNESYFLGADAPEFVVLKIEPIDNRLPMTEDALALISLLKHYRPLFLEQGYLLLEQDSTAAQIPPVSPPTIWNSAKLGEDIPIGIAAGPTNAFIHLDLSLAGEIYSLLLREPNLIITLNSTNGEHLGYRLIRPTAASGFMINPIVLSGSDWARLYLGRSLPNTLSFRIDAETPRQRMFFKPTFTAAFQRVDVLQATQTTAPPELVGAIYPGFNLMPTTIHGLTNTIVEDKHDSVFLHAPATMSFEPPEGQYDISAVFGINAAALNDPACASANADGIGVSLVRQHTGAEMILWHGEIDPFHVPQDSGAHRLDMKNIVIVSGDSVDYRVDPGHGGNNTACDWSYVRDLVFLRHTDHDATQ